MKVNCFLKGCKSVFVSSDTPSPDGVRYVCSKHTDEELTIAGILRTKRTDRDVHFQSKANEPYDSDYATPGHPLGTQLGRKVNQRYCHPLPMRPDDGSKTFSSMIEELNPPTEPTE